MQADTASLPADGTPGPAARLISIPFLLLRVSTAGGAFAMGLVQTLVFARVLTPDRFSLFILVGAIGYSLWLCDLGLAKILFVQLRTAHLAGKTDARAASQATAVIVFYVLLAAAGSFICFGFMAARPSVLVTGSRRLRPVLFLHHAQSHLGLPAQPQHRRRRIRLLRKARARAPRRQHGDHPRHADRAAVHRFSGRLERALGGAGDLRGGEAAEPQRDGAAVARLCPRALGVLPDQYAIDRAQRHFRAERYFHLHVPLLRRAVGVRPRRADHYSRSDLSHFPRRQRHLYRGLRPRDPRTDPRARGARRAEADPYDADRGGAVLPAGRFRLRPADLRVEAIVRVPARIGGDRAADGHADSGRDAAGQPRANGGAIAVAACRLLPRNIAHRRRRCRCHGGSQPRSRSWPN